MIFFPGSTRALQTPIPNKHGTQRTLPLPSFLRSSTDSSFPFQQSIQGCANKTPWQRCRPGPCHKKRIQMISIAQSLYCSFVGTSRNRSRECDLHPLASVARPDNRFHVEWHFQPAQSHVHDCSIHSVHNALFHIQMLYDEPFI